MQRLIVFTREPIAGQTKTRLIPRLGEIGAANLQREMTEHAVGWARCVRNEAEIEIRHTGDAAAMRRWLGPAFRYRPQGEGDLGGRMRRATEEAFAAGIQRVVVIGTDCPQLTAAIMRQAFDALHQHDLVIGPASDGGYYLIGMRQPTAAVFAGLDWGTASVRRDTLAIADRIGRSVAMLDELDDVDRPDDLAVWEAAKTQAAPPDRAGRVSVIVPARNEATTIGPTLDAMRGGHDVEIIVVDGGSTDDTAGIAEQHGARVITSEPGRAMQMNAGAAAANGAWLVFCHADTRLPGGFDTIVRRTLNEGGVSVGAFTLRIDGAGIGLRVIEQLVAFRSRVTAMPYGDQALFVSRDVFDRLGGYRGMALMEDWDFVRRAARCGRVRVVPQAVVTSGRMWRRRGLWRTTAMNQAVLAGYAAGVPLGRLAAWRSGKRTRGA